MYRKDKKQKTQLRITSQPGVEGIAITNTKAPNATIHNAIGHLYFFITLISESSKPKNKVIS